MKIYEDIRTTRIGGWRKRGILVWNTQGGLGEES